MNNQESQEMSELLETSRDDYSLVPLEDLIGAAEKYGILRGYDDCYLAIRIIYDITNTLGSTDIMHEAASDVDALCASENSQVPPLAGVVFPVTIQTIEISQEVPLAVTNTPEETNNVIIFPVSSMVDDGLPEENNSSFEISTLAYISDANEAGVASTSTSLGTKPMTASSHTLGVALHDSDTDDTDDDNHHRDPNFIPSSSDDEVSITYGNDPLNQKEEASIVSRETTMMPSEDHEQTPLTRKRSRIITAREQAKRDRERGKSCVG